MADTASIHRGRDDHDAIRAFAVLSVLFFAGIAGAYVYTASWSLPFPRDGTSLVVGRDFLNYWMYGRAAFGPDPGQLYDPLVYNSALSKLLGTGYPAQNWSYPPSMMLLAAPFGRLNYLTALLLWTLLGIAALAWVGSRHFTKPRLLIALVLSPAAIFGVISGQLALLIAAVMVLIFACMDRRPVIAGVLIGLLTLKPQVGLLFPIMLVASARWRTFLAAAVTAVALAALTAAVFGPHVWVDFVIKGLPVQNLVLTDPERIATPFYPTVFMNLRGIDVGYAFAMTIQAVFSVTAAGAVFWAYRFRGSADPGLMMALFFACSVSATPYLLSYDTLAMAFAALWLLDSGKLDGPGRRLMQLVYWLPLLQLALGTWHLPGPALIAPAFAVYLVMRLRAAAPAPHAISGHQASPIAT